MKTNKGNDSKESKKNQTEHQTNDDNSNVRIPLRESYPSDLTTLQWQEVDIVIPIDPLRGRKRDTSFREVLNAMNYRWSTGCSWRMLPHDLPPWPTVYTYFRRWLKDGTLKQIREILHKPSLKRKRDKGDSEQAA